MRRVLAGLVMMVTAACSTTPADVDDPLAAPALPDSSTTAPPASKAPSATSPPSTSAPIPVDIQDLAATTTMTERGRRLFLAASPAIEDAATFGANCGIDNLADARGARTHTQGCYVAGRIHLLAPDRAQAHDLLYVTAAHELLHAVYASLGPADRVRIDAELQAARPGNERLEERLKPYGSSPTLVNEIHSILGSEFEGVSPALEAHYAQFFASRAAVVAFRQRTLGAREDEMQRLRAEISDLGEEIDTLKANQAVLRAAGNIRAFNASVPVVNGLVDRYNADISALSALIDEYNGLLGG